MEGLACLHCPRAPWSRYGPRHFGLSFADDRRLTCVIPLAPFKRPLAVLIIPEASVRFEVEKATVGALRRIFALALAAVAAILLPGLALADDVTPRVSPDRIGDVPATMPDPFPAFSNFSWRAFIALNWPALPDAAHRGQPDRGKTLGDSGFRVWETFKSRYEVFQHDRGGRALIPSGWNSYDGKNPCAPDGDNRVKTLNAFSTFADFNQATFKPGEFGNPLGKSVV